jgi:hypothetical protein
MSRYLLAPLGHMKFVILSVLPHVVLMQFDLRMSRYFIECTPLLLSHFCLMLTYVALSR